MALKGQLEEFDGSMGTERLSCCSASLGARDGHVGSLPWVKEGRGINLDYGSRPVSRSWGWEKGVKVNKLARKVAELVVSLGVGKIEEIFSLGLKKSHCVPPFPLPPKKGKQTIVSRSGAEELWSLALGGCLFVFFP